MDVEKRKKLHRILDLVIDRNEGGNATFFYFYGHTNSAEVELCDGVWVPERGCVMHKTNVENQNMFETLDEVIKALC